MKTPSLDEVATPNQIPPSGTEASTDPIGHEIASSRATEGGSARSTDTRTPEIPKPASKVWKRVAPGIYRYLKSQTLYERPWINGRRTYRSLGTTDLQAAKCEFRRRRGLSPEPARDRPLVRAMLEFNLPEAQERFEASAKGLEWKSVIVELDRQYVLVDQEATALCLTAQGVSGPATAAPPEIGGEGSQVGVTCSRKSGRSRNAKPK